MRIVFESLGFDEGDEFGGVSRVAATHARGLVNAGHQVTAICTNRKSRGARLFPGFAEVNRDGLRILFFDTATLPVWPGAFGPHRVRLNEAFEQAIATADVVHLNDFYTALGTHSAKRALELGKAVFLQPHGSLSRANGHRWLNQAMRLFYRQGRMLRDLEIIALTAAERDYCLARGFPASRVHVIPNGIDFGDFVPTAPVGTFRRANAIPEDAPLIMNLARIQLPIKGQDIAVRAFAALRRKDAWVAFVGPDTGFVPQLRQLAATLGVVNRVVFAGAVYGSPAVATALQDCDIYLQPSRYEAFSTSVLEAAASGKPMVVTCSTGNPSPLGDRCALAVPPTPEAIANALDRLLAEPDLRRRFEVAGPQIISDQYSLRATLSSFERLYEAAVASRTPAPPPSAEAPTTTSCAGARR